MAKSHPYNLRVTWTGNAGSGTATYSGYLRDHIISAEGKPDLLGSADPTFRGDPTRYNPEELLVAALSSCHMLSYLHLCAVSGLVVESYKDEAMGVMEESSGGSGHFLSVVLRPKVQFAGEPDFEMARRLHAEAHHLCFIANSVNFPVTCEPSL